MNYKGCIFDLDGTLANTLASIAHFGNRALAAFGLPPIETEEYKMMVGNGADKLIERMVARAGVESKVPLDLRAIRKQYDLFYEAEPMKLVTAYEGLPELMRALRTSGVRVGVVSNKPDNMTKFIVKELYGDLVEAAHGQRAGVPKKPDPTAVLQTADELGLTPQEILYIGDSGVDMETGANAKMDTCGVLWGFRDKDELVTHGAKMLAKNADELAAHIGVDAFWAGSWGTVDKTRVAEYIAENDLAADELTDELHRRGVKTVCDAGCGCGIATAKLAANGFTVSGFDVAAPAVELARQLLDKHRLHAELKVASILQTGYPDAAFDAVVSKDVVDHLRKKDGRRAIAELLRITKSGGTVVLTLDALDEEYETEPHEISADGDFIFTAGKWHGMVFHPYSEGEVCTMLPPNVHCIVQDHGGELTVWVGK